MGRAAELFVACLEAEGVEYIFGVPGEENLDLLDALRTSDRIEFVVTRHEQHAAFMAATYGRLTGRPGVCLSTLGPGATNLVTGVAYAQLGGMPLVAITGQKPVRENRQGNFQMLDVVQTFAPLTKWNRSIVEAATIPRWVRHAFKAATAERPGATHLELPEDVAADDVDARPHSPEPVRRPVADTVALERAEAMLREARTPVLVVSGGANRKRVGRELVALCEATGIYAVTTQMGKGALPEDHPQSLFCLGIHKADYGHRILEWSDCVVTVGYNIAEYPPSVWNPAQDKRILHVDFTPAEPDAFYDPAWEVVGDIAHTLQALRGALDGTRWDCPDLAGWRNHAHHWRCTTSRSGVMSCSQTIAASAASRGSISTTMASRPMPSEARVSPRRYQSSPWRRAQAISSSNAPRYSGTANKVRSSCRNSCIGKSCR